MIEEFKDYCTGCRACEKLCPKGAITMERDYKGFLYPKVNYDKCVKCGLCKNRCPINNKEVYKEKKAYAAYNKDEKIRMESTSGGIFTLFAENIIDKKGVVFGAAFNEDLQVEHIRVENKSDLNKLRTSKYVQSDTKDTYVEAKELLENGRLVYFSGAPCQIEGLKAYLGKDYENLILQDIICHGVPSPKVWKAYLDSKKQKINSVNFRNKEKSSWENYQMKITYENDVEYIDRKINPYMILFLKNSSLRESCYNCKFKKENRESDITLADFWGINKIDETMNDGKGTSLLLINSEKGNKLLEEISDKIVKKEVDFKTAIENNLSMIRSCRKGDKYDEISNLIREGREEEIFKENDKNG